MASASRAAALAALIGAVTPAGAQGWDRPPPEVFARAEDRARARLLGQPCTAADADRGCYRYNGALVRHSPCSYRISAVAFGRLPTDQCFRMDPPRRYHGMWIDAFEGQQFIPEGTTLPAAPRYDDPSPAARAQRERLRAATIWLDVDRVGLRHDGRGGAPRRMIAFVGRRTKYLGRYGHMGSSGHEIIVDRVIAVQPLD